MTKLLNAGIHEIDATTYHEDPAKHPSLSASLARVLCSQSPAHARAAHPRLNPDYQRQESEKFDVGAAAHALYLEGRSAVGIVDAKDWRTNDAKIQRDEIRADGRVPLLAHQWDVVQEMCAAVGQQVEGLPVTPRLFDLGQPEQTLIWTEEDVTCRARLDWLHDDYSAIDDLKTTSRSANPIRWSRSLFESGFDIQAAFYLRGLKALRNIDAVFRWVVVENYPPYALAVFELGPDALAVANAKVDYAIRTWRDCLQRDEWRAYPTRLCSVELPAWEEARWMEREQMEAAA